MSEHPYPKHVVTAVAKALMKSSETRDAFGAGGDWDAAGFLIKQEFLDHANTALRTLWDASRVEDYDQLNDIPESAVVLPREGDACTPYDMFHKRLPANDFPANIIYWGDPE